MGKNNFLEILKDLKENKAQAELEHVRLIENLDSMIEKAETIIKSDGIQVLPSPSEKDQIPKEKVNIEDVLAVLRKTTKTVHIDEICQKIGDKRGCKVSRISISMLVAHYIKRLKSKAEIKKLERFNYKIK